MVRSLRALAVGGAAWPEAGENIFCAQLEPGRRGVC